MTHPAPLPSTTPGADVPQHMRLGTARSTKLNNWLMAHPHEVAKHNYPELADIASAALGMALSRGHVSYRVDELRRAGDLPPKASEGVQPTPPLAVPGPQLTLVKELEANEFETAAQIDRPPRPMAMTARQLPASSCSK